MYSLKGLADGGAPGPAAAHKTPVAARQRDNGQPVNEQVKATTMVSTGNTTVCDAGHVLPCPICGATDERDCNGGQYVSPQLRTPPRTERQAAQAIRRRNRITEQEREARDG
jgi:hypothetical protein